MQTKREIQELLSAAGVSPNRKLGQHFLVDLNLMRLLVDAAGIGPGDVVLEIGTGTGSLTEALAERAGHIVTVELDPTLAEVAQSRLADAANVQIVNADVLSGKGTINPAVTEAVTEAQARLRGKGPEGEWHKHPVSETSWHRRPADAAWAGRPCHGYGRLLLVSNLPYDVASSVMINLVKGPVTADAMFVTVQKEVAQRMTAAPGGRDYGTLSIFLQATGAVEMLRRLKPSVFWPPPAVDSAIIRYLRDPDRSRRILDMDLFGAVIGLFIGHRRKMLRACIKDAPPELEGPELWPKIFERQNIDPTRRPEELSPQQYVDLANACYQLIHTHTQ